MFTPQQNEAMLKATGGVPVVFGGVTTYGHHETYDGEFFEEDRAPVYGVVDAVLVATGILPALKVRQAITVNGVAKKVLGHRRPEEHGGDLTLIGLGRA